MLANHAAAASQMLATSPSTGAMPRSGLQATLEGRGSLPGCIAWQKGTWGFSLLSGSLQYTWDQESILFPVVVLLLNGFIDFEQASCLSTVSDAQNC